MEDPGPLVAALALACRPLEEADEAEVALETSVQGLEDLAACTQDLAPADQREVRHLLLTQADAAVAAADAGHAAFLRALPDHLGLAP